MSEPSKANYRPRQSCLRCRQRKIKCNRLQPCLACSKRGLGAECSYVTNDEDRFQISQANIISNLRKEVNHLKRKLAHREESASELFDDGTAEASYGSSTSSGSPASSRPFKIQKRMVDAHPDGQSYLAMAPAPPAPGFAPFANGMMPNHDHIANPTGAGGTGLVPFPPPASNAVPGSDLMAGIVPVTLQQGLPQTMDYGSNYPSVPFVSGADQGFMNAGLIQHQQPDLWKGKEDLLRRLYDIIRDCDDTQVPTIIDIVRNSRSPEEALSLAQQVLITSPSSTNSSMTYDSMPT